MNKSIRYCKFLPIIGLTLALFACQDEEESGREVNNSTVVADLEADMVLVPGGTFQMGATNEQTDSWYSEEKPVHSVTVDSFYISKYETTNTQYAAFLNANDIKSPPSAVYEGVTVRLITSTTWGVSFDVSDSTWKAREGYENYPATSVSWFGAKAYCEWAGGRLPSEAEWEFAARGGTLTQNYKFCGGNDPIKVGWNMYNDNESPERVGGKLSNELGLYDMSGNAYEWCLDYKTTYLDTAQVNPLQYLVFSSTSTAPTWDGFLVLTSALGVGNTYVSAYRVVRGGCWYSYKNFTRTTYRGNFVQGNENNNGVGFRLVREY
jgi:formylglycine-generating enzyme required for sulfatase activity